MELWVGSDLERFSARAEAFVRSRIEHNVLASLLTGAQQNRYSDLRLGVVADERGQTVAVAMRAPPHNLVVAGEISAPGELINAWLAQDPAIPGVLGAPEPAGALARAWVRQTGGDSEIHLREALHVLDRVILKPTLTPGALRRADWRLGAQLAEWAVAFALDAGLSAPDAAPAAIQAQLEQDRLYVWQRDGEAVTMVGHAVAAGAVVRVGPVFTPAVLRGRGYATAATAALSQLLLDGGAERCVLYTDLANPVSNHVYAKIGYVRLADWVEIRLRPPD